MILNRQPKREPALLILGEATDPHNLGSILRTADEPMPQASSFPKHRAVRGNSSGFKKLLGGGTHSHARVTNLSRTLDKLKEEGFWIFGTDMNGAIYTSGIRLSKLALIIGNEGKGISANIKKASR